MRKNDRIGGDKAGDNDGDAAAFAAARIAAVQDDPAGRLALARSIHEEPTGRRSQRPRFRRAALAFTHWICLRAVRGDTDPITDGLRENASMLGQEYTIELDRHFRVRG
jgi:hypothetical protein